ncbi:MAG: DeoR/GlpR transcriptional regulator [Lachnospiraceae bacterium]|nr:DeoR/GlpR transcriptional regulator [Lachnospiraceae bacterium]
MNAENRQIAIYEMIKSNKEMSVVALAQCFGVSAMTIRRDLDQLERSKLIERAYGKALIADESKIELSYSMRKSMNLASKQKIALLAAKFISERDIRTIYADGSSTVMEVLKVLPPNRSLTVFTNSIVAMNLLLPKTWIDTFVIGGFLNREVSSMDDITSADLCKQIYVDATFTSCSDISVDGMFNSGTTGTEIRRIMMKNSQHNYLLADHSKFNSRGIFLLNTWDKVDTLITDEKPDAAFINALRRYGVSIVW